MNKTKLREKLNRMMLLAVALLCSTGCALFLVGAGAAVGVGTVAYVKGELRAADSVPFDQACRAVDQALDDLQLKGISSQQDNLTKQVTARTADDRHVRRRNALARNLRQNQEPFLSTIRIVNQGDEG
jgi:hypothetical protein